MHQVEFFAKQSRTDRVTTSIRRGDASKGSANTVNCCCIVIFESSVKEIRVPEAVVAVLENQPETLAFAAFLALVLCLLVFYFVF